MNHAEWFFCLLEKLGKPLRPGTRVLEIGCGNGDLVHTFRERGIDAVGCDLEFKEGPRMAAMRDAGLIKHIERQPYRLPFDAASFDLIISMSVLEHVMNVRETVAEMARITRPGGAGLHIFPSRYRFIEPHSYVPLATLVRTRAWLGLWAALGIRNGFQMHMKPAEIAKRNYDYLRQGTNYLSRAKIRIAFEKDFAVAFCEDSLIACATGSLANRIGMAPLMERSAALTWLYSAFRERALWVQKR